MKYLENDSTFLKRISTEACVTSYTQTGKFGHLLSAEDTRASLYLFHFLN